MAQSLRLLTLRLRNFKGVREFSLDASGGNVSIYGDNATGKTTLNDAWNWLLFDKDSANRSTFEIKTLGTDGQALHNLEHEVEGTLDADGRTVTLRKVFTEQWTKKRGSATPEFTGHTTDYYVDGVPVKLAEYKARVAQIADEATFRLLTDPRYFNEQLHWQKRREILLAVCGDVSDLEVITSNRNLAALPEILGNRTLADHRKVILARRTEINKELDRIPVRIDEATRALPEAGGDRAAIRAQIEAVKAKRQEKAAEIVRIDAGGEVAEKQRTVREIEGKMIDLSNLLRSEASKALQLEQPKLTEAIDKAEAKRREISRLKGEAQEGDRQAQQLQARLAALRQEWHTIDERQITLSVEEVCPACGQSLPAERVEAAREKALSDFNTRKACDLEANVIEGKRLKGELDRLLEAQKQRTADIEKAEASLQYLNADVARLQGHIDQLRQSVPDPEQDPEYRSLRAKKSEIEQEIASLKAGSSEQRQQVGQAIRELDEQIGALEGQIARIDQRQAGLARIEELAGQEKALAAEFERLEKELYLTEEFIRAKVRLLEERINSRFVYARFKLFNVLVNGAVEECCETLFEGVPYSTALNSGARTNVGLDIINTLSEHYRFEAPIWIDNSEAVTRLITVKAQVIRLVVSEPDKKLRVDVDPVTLKEAV